jgi:hypothetical protein
MYALRWNTPPISFRGDGSVRKGGTTGGGGTENREREEEEGWGEERAECTAPAEEVCC